MKLTEFVVADAIIPELKATTKEAAIREIIASLREAGRIPAEHGRGDRGRHHEAGRARLDRHWPESPFRTRNMPSVNGMVATVALSSPGLEFASLDGEDVHIVFLLISPPDRPGDHLRALETITPATSRATTFVTSPAVQDPAAGHGPAPGGG